MDSGAGRPGVRILTLAQLALLVTGVAGLVVLTWLINHGDSFVFTMHLDIQFKDILGRVVNLTNLRQNGNIYVPFGYQAFTYPPGAILFFWPILWVPIQHLTLVWTFASLAALAGSFYVALSYLGAGRRLTRAGVSCWAAIVSAMVFPEIIECLVWGQTATILLLFVLADMLAVRAPARGILVGVATAVKIYPGLFIIVWLLRRQWRAAATASATAATLTGVAYALWPASGHTFVHDVLFGGEEFQKLANSLYATKSNSVIAFFQRPPFPHAFLSAHEGVAISAAVMALCLVSAQRLWRGGFELSAALVVLIAGAVAAPVAWDHYFSFLPFLAVAAWECGPSSAFGATALGATIVGVVPWTLFRAPTATSTWATTYSYTARDALLFATLSVVVAGLFSPSRGAGRGRRRRLATARAPARV